MSVSNPETNSSAAGEPTDTSGLDRDNAIHRRSTQSETLLHEYGCSDLSCVNPWTTSICSAPFAPLDLCSLVTTIEFVHNKRSVQEISRGRTRVKRVFKCSNCPSFLAEFVRPNKSSKDKESPFFLKAIPSKHSYGCPQVSEVPSKDVLVNHPIFVNFLKRRRLQTGAWPAQKEIIQHLASHGITLKLAKSTISRAVRVVKEKLVKREATLPDTTDPDERVESLPSEAIVHLPSTSESETNEDDETAHEQPNETSTNTVAKPTASMLLNMDYFDSSESKKLFLGDTKSPLSVRLVLQQRIDKLRRVSKYPDGWRELVENNDSDNICSPYDIFVLRQRAQILCLAYMLALKHMPRHRWTDCCSKACAELNKVGNEAATAGVIVTHWNATLRSNNERFGATIKSRAPRKRKSASNDDSSKKQCHNEKENNDITMVAL